MIPSKRNVAAVCHDGRIRLIEQKMPALKQGWVLVKVKASLVSPGTELGGWPKLAANFKTPAEPHDPKPFGYSNAGDVLAVGDGVTRFKPSQRVACVGAGYAQHTDFALVPQNLCFAISDDMTYEQGSYAMLAATALNAIRRMEPQLGEYGVVVGLGIVGLLAGKLMKLSGMEVMGWDTLDFRLGLADRMGIDHAVNVTRDDPVAAAREFTRKAGLDAALFAFGGDATKAYEQVMSSMKVTPDTHVMGRVVLVGGVKFPLIFDTSNHDIRFAARTGPGYHDEAWEEGRDYPPVFMRWTTRTNIELCLRLISQGKLDVDALTTHQIPLANVEDGVTAILDDPQKILGVIFNM